MNAEMEKLYHLIGQSVVDAIPESWETATLSIDLDPGVVTARGYYVSEKDLETRSFKVNYATIKHFKALHAIMSDAPQRDWKHAKFVINQAGHFDLSFEYD